jgi:hypothetical protein
MANEVLNPISEHKQFRYEDHYEDFVSDNVVLFDGI